ncbi:MAG TPA: hypothetical protein VIT45_16480 [Allosphingosinicella sp.]
MDEATRDLDSFLAKFTPEVDSLAHKLLDRMKTLVPGATIMVYDNYNALAIGFCADEKVSHAVLSLAVMPRWVTLCFLFGKGLPDPHGLLRGEGSRVRHVRLHEQAALDDPRILALVEEAVSRSEPPFDPAAEQKLVIKSVSAKQRPRRPREN